MSKLRDLINQIQSIGNRPQIREWREKTLIEVEKLEAALKFYADGPTTRFFQEKGVLNLDDGERARKALGRSND